MTLAQSIMVKLGSQMPEFHLKDVTTGKLVSFEDFEENEAMLIMFMCQHCPYVQHIAEEISQIAKDYAKKGVGIVAICSNDIENYPDDSPKNLRDMAEEYDFTFPFLHDDSQEVAADFAAACTPDFFLYDEDRKLVYRGQLDDSRPENGKPVTGKDLREAIEKVLSGRSIPESQKPSSGCSIKWKAGNEPIYSSEK